MADKSITQVVHEPKRDKNILIAYQRSGESDSVSITYEDGDQRYVATWTPSVYQRRALRRALKFCLPEFKWRMILSDGTRFQTEAEKNAEETALGDPGAE
jgi:hypothetical protein